MTFAHTCACGRRIPKGGTCPVCSKRRRAPAPPVPESVRLALNPNRASYVSAKYRKNRMVRYHAVGGICERRGCGARLRGALWPLGVSWQCHHITQPMGDRDDVVNLRCYCGKHHNKYTK